MGRISIAQYEFFHGSLLSKMLGKGDSSRISIAVHMRAIVSKSSCSCIAMPSTPPCSLCRLAPFFLSAQHRWFRRRGDPSRTQLRNSANELYRNRFGDRETDRPLSQRIAPELIFDRREERARRGKQRVVFVEAGDQDLI